MLSKRLRNRIITILLACAITFVGIFSVVKATGVDSFKLSDSSIIYDNTIKHSKPKILIYHTHTCEKYIDSDVIDTGNDLAKKLEKKGYLVEHIKDDFSKDYNGSYHASREYLESIDLSQYSLILDIHRDCSPSGGTVRVNGNDISSISFVSTKLNPNRDSEVKIINALENNLSKSNGKAINNGVVELYNYGISYYNADLSPNMLLVEIGNEQTTYTQNVKACTYLASAIDSYLSNK